MNPVTDEISVLFIHLYSSLNNQAFPFVCLSIPLICHVYSIYRNTPNKRPWAFAGSVVFKSTFSPSRSFLRNENRSIFSRDIAKNVKNDPSIGSQVVGRGVYSRGAFIGGFTVYIIRVRSRMSWSINRHYQCCMQIIMNSFSSPCP